MQENEIENREKRVEQFLKMAKDNHFGRLYKQKK